MWQSTMSATSLMRRQVSRLCWPESTCGMRASTAGMSPCSSCHTARSVAAVVPCPATSVCEKSLGSAGSSCKSCPTQWCFWAAVSDKACSRWQTQSCRAQCRVQCRVQRSATQTLTAKATLWCGDESQASLGSTPGQRHAVPPAGPQAAGQPRLCPAPLQLRCAPPQPARLQQLLLLSSQLTDIACVRFAVQQAEVLHLQEVLHGRGLGFQ